jgi:cytidyltransferase-like protein
MGRILTDTELVEAVARERQAGHTIAFANGCFDVLHVGHTRYLDGARREADRLIVAINDDSRCVRSRAGRPILPPRRANRGRAPHGGPVVCFRKDVRRHAASSAVLQGTDYSVDTVPEREVVGYGGQIAVVSDGIHRRISLRASLRTGHGFSSSVSDRQRPRHASRGGGDWRAPPDRDRLAQ